MSNHRHHTGHHTSLRRWLVAAAMIPALGLGVMVPAHADPDAVAAAQQRLDRIQQQQAELAEKHAALQEKLDKSRARLSSVRADLSEQQQEVSGLTEGLGRLALMQYRQDGGSLTVSLLTSPDDESFLNDLASRQSVINRANAQLQELQVAQAEMEALQRAAEQAKSEIAADTKESATLLKDFDAKEAQAEATLERLTREEQERLAELERQRAEAAAQRAAEQARAEEQASRSESRTTSQSTSSNSTGSTGSTASSSDSAAPAAPAVSSSSSGRASQALAFAKSQVGKPYVFGATGPGAYDCSGLTGAAYRSAGVSLPRTSGSQYGVGTAVSMSQLQPGDLVFYYAGISHVGIYAGNGMIVHAANPRSGVTYAPVGSMPFMGGRRVA